MPNYIKYPVLAASWFTGISMVLFAGGFLFLETLHWMVLNPPW